MKLFVITNIARVELLSGEVTLPMLALLSIFWSCRRTTNANNLVETIDGCPNKAKISEKRECGYEQNWIIVVDTKLGADGKDNRIARGLKPVNAQPAGETAACTPRLDRLQASHCGEALSLTCSNACYRCTNVESDKTTAIHKVKLTEAVSSLGNDLTL